LLSIPKIYVSNIKDSDCSPERKGRQLKLFINQKNRS
jgi:hypothetical protein